MSEDIQQPSSAFDNINEVRQFVGGDLRHMVEVTANHEGVKTPKYLYIGADWIQSRAFEHVAHIKVILGFRYSLKSWLSLNLKAWRWLRCPQTQIIEQSLVLETPKGLIVITGCAHPGIEDIVARAAEIREGELLLVMGGFHLMRTGKGAVEKIANKFKDAGIKYAAPTHCSGGGTLKIFREVFGDKFITLGAGKVLYPDEL